MSYTVIKIETNDREKEIINPSDNDFYKRLFLVSLSYVDYGRYVFAENTQDAIDEVFDYELETNGRHFFLDEKDVLENSTNADGEEIDIIRAGNNSLPLPAQDVSAFEIHGEEKQQVIAFCQEKGFSFLA